MNDKTIEQEIQSKGLTAPRVTPADIEAEIASECFFTAWDAFTTTFDAGKVVCREFDYDTLRLPPPAASRYEATRCLTFCVLVLRNGFTVTGESACASPENFDAEIGRTIARQNAVQKIWPLLGFRLRDQLSSGRADT